jgi:CHAT domain-containing protein/tetratricopeptide (TPR) repeat protein
MLRHGLLHIVAMASVLAVAGAARGQEAKQGQTGEQKEKLLERDKYGKEALALEGTGKIAEAIAAAEKMLALERSIFGNVHEEVAGSLTLLGRLHERQEDFGSAVTVRKEALEVWIKLRGNEAWQVTDARLEVEQTETLANLGAKAREELRRADGQMNQAAALFQAGKYQQGAELAEKALATRAGLLGEKNRLVADCADWAGSLWDRAGNLKKARPFYERALTIYKKALGDNHPHTATSLNNLGAFLERQGDYAAARPYLVQALAIRKRVLGDNHPETARSLDSMGVLLQSQGDYAAARASYEQALAIYKKVFGENHSETATALNNLGSVLQNQGDHAAARIHYEQALAIYKKVLGDNHPHTAASLLNLGNLLSNQGEYAAARYNYEQALAVYKSVLGDTHPATATCLSNLGGLLQNQGDYAAARIYYEQALAICKKALGNNHPDTARSHNNLGLLLSNQGDHASARSHFEEALAICKKVLGDNHRYTAATLSCLGVSQLSQGDFAAARPHLEEALAICKNVLGASHPDTASAFNNLGALLKRQGDYEAARAHYDQALAIYKKVLGHNHPATASALNNLGALLECQGDDAAARSNFEQALAIQHKSLDMAATALSERQQLAMNETLRGYLDRWLSLPPKSGLADAGFYEPALAWKGSVSLRQQQLRLLRQEPGLAGVASELQAVTARLATLASTRPDPTKADEQRRLLVELTSKKEDLEVDLARRSVTFRRGQQVMEVNAEKLRTCLPADAALIDFLEYAHSEPDAQNKGKFLYTRKLTAFVVRKEQPIVRVDLGPVEAIRQAVEAWRQGALARSSFQGKDQRGQEMRRLLWQPLEKHLGGASTVLIAPDGAVAMVPFAALPGKQPGKFLLEEISVAVVPLPRLVPSLLQEQLSVPGSETMLLVGDVDYGAAAGKSESVAGRSAVRAGKGRFNFGPLEGTRGEILAVRDSFETRFATGKVTMLRQAAATEAAFRQLAPQSRWLHLATHGFFMLPEMKPAQSMARGDGLDLFGSKDVVGFHPGLLSGLALAGANREPAPGEDDGILTALECAELDLRRTELVVLSACETGLGKVAGGEGILGLQRGFQLAGARTTVTSLWKVDDNATRLLMEKFYENLWKHKLPKAEALRQAQLTMLREGPKRGVVRVDEGGAMPAVSPPYYWAAFVLSGDWR